jgi:succinate dehydrogenase / fumarate reductase flavoprotein subunit
VARCIVREVKEGRGSPHGGVFLDISWIKKAWPTRRSTSRRKLPSMYHQFKQAWDIDITREPMEVRSDDALLMGGVRVDSDTQMRPMCRGSLRPANALRASTARTGSGAIRLSDLIVFGKRAGEFAANRQRGQWRQVKRVAGRETPGAPWTV